MDAPLTRRLLETMTLIRRFEEQVAACFAAGEIPGFIHLSVGQEAIPAVFCAALEPADLVSATHRGHGVVLAKGADVRATMAEIFGKQAGLCHGRGGSMHLADLPHGIIGTNGSSGASSPIATGAWRSPPGADRP
ncbi:MAG: thiamine pyrophosphate-dependent enzyme [Dehalococcoidia bacterium]